MRRTPALVGTMVALAVVVGFVGTRTSSTAPTTVPSCTWSLVASPDGSTSRSRLLAVASVPATSEVWAVGWSLATGVAQTLIEHWNGTAWSLVPSPNVGAGSNRLTAVAARSATDVWAVGDTAGSNGYQTLAEHWNGTSWVVVPT